MELPASWKCHNVFHVSLLKEYTPGRVAPPPPVEINGEWEFRIEAIIGHRDITYGRRRKDGTRPTKRQFLVKWLGYTAEHNSWEPESSLRADAPVIVDLYLLNPTDMTKPPTANDAAQRGH